MPFVLAWGNRLAQTPAAGCLAQLQIESPEYAIYQGMPPFYPAAWSLGQPTVMLQAFVLDPAGPCGFASSEVLEVFL